MGHCSLACGLACFVSDVCEKSRESCDVGMFQVVCSQSRTSSMEGCSNVFVLDTNSLLLGLTDRMNYGNKELHSTFQNQKGGCEGAGGGPREAVRPCMPAPRQTRRCVTDPGLVQLHVPLPPPLTLAPPPCPARRAHLWAETSRRCPHHTAPGHDATAGAPIG